jgi:hypothetical protein
MKPIFFIALSFPFPSAAAAAFVCIVAQNCGKSNRIPKVCPVHRKPAAAKKGTTPSALWRKGLSFGVQTNRENGDRRSRITVGGKTAGLALFRQPSKEERASGWLAIANL